jgi:23S rRNA (cytidine1920-2'-O)/16S rRNA (cytidine1409-2'-O)-methyltransferase
VARKKKLDRGKYVGRGAMKLISALEIFPVKIESKICADVGSSTGGFTEVLLEMAAQKVFAIDVGYGELDYKLRINPRVVVMERTNARYLEKLPEKPDVVTIDVSFISLKQILPAVLKWINKGADIIMLVKPQFEAKKEDVAEGGVITDAGVHRKVLQDILEWCESQNLSLSGLIVSGLEGAKGNKEFFLWAKNIKTDRIVSGELLANLKL